MASFKMTLNSRVGKISAAVRSKLADHLEKTSKELLATAQEEAPVDEGTLRASGIEESTGDLSRQVAFTAEHAIYVHEGTINQDADPFLSRSAEQIRGKFEKGVVDAVKDAVGR